MAKVTEAQEAAEVAEVAIVNTKKMLTRAKAATQLQLKARKASPQRVDTEAVIAEAVVDAVVIVVIAEKMLTLSGGTRIVKGSRKLREHQAKKDYQESTIRLEKAKRVEKDLIDQENNIIMIPERMK